MCDCAIKLEREFLDRFINDSPDLSEKFARISCRDMEANVLLTGKKNGRTKKRVEFAKFNYCPFCGEKIGDE